MGKSRISDPLRQIVRERVNEQEYCVIDAQSLSDIADVIESEHERRMEGQSRELTRSFCRYMMSVLEDYKHGRKRTVRSKCIGIWHPTRGCYTCSNCNSGLYAYQRYCGGCGSKVKYQSNGSKAVLD